MNCRKHFINGQWIKRFMCILLIQLYCISCKIQCCCNVVADPTDFLLWFLRTEWLVWVQLAPLGWPWQEVVPAEDPRWICVQYCLPNGQCEYLARYVISSVNFQNLWCAYSVFNVDGDLVCVYQFVVLTFWGIYAVDRELVYPKHLDKIVPVWLNHIMVGMSTKPKSGAVNLHATCTKFYTVILVSSYCILVKLIVEVLSLGADRQPSATLAFKNFWSRNYIFLG